MSCEDIKTAIAEAEEIFSKNLRYSENKNAIFDMIGAVDDITLAIANLSYEELSKNSEAIERYKNQRNNFIKKLPPGVRQLWDM